MPFPYTFEFSFDSGYFIEADWDNDGDFVDTYDDLTINTKSIHFSRGKSNELGTADVGQLSITLNNDDGLYTPSNSGGNLYGSLLPKRPIKVYYSGSGTDYPLFYGFIEEIIPHPHKTEQDCIINATDGLDFLSRHDMSTALYKDTLTGTIHGYILTDAGWSATMRTLDAGQDTVPYWYGHDVKARFAQTEIDDNEQGFSYVDGSGYFNFEDRHHRSTSTHQTSQATFNNTMSYISNPLSPKNVYNIIKVTVTPWSLQSLTTLWALQETPSIPAGESRTWWADASVSGQSVFVDAWTTLVATTDYTANSQSDGGGTDMTSDIAVTLSKLAKTMKITLTNNGSIPAYITLLQARGTYYDDLTKVTLKAEDSTSQTAYQKRTYELDGKYMTDSDKAQDYVTYAIGKYKDPRAELSMSAMNQDSTILAKILALEISDRVTVVNTLLGVNDDYFIDYMEHNISMSGKLHTVNYRLADTINEDFWCLDYSALASSSTEGQTKLGY
uniref:Putative tail protein n=1 Tax=viral metagenome TaxID=1070528 RepID=A0A6M3KU47_9ZZZZ